ncbi:hypothetical protein DFH09DRAFT_1421641 [Mycena vulgaris]|nr:hypothetical protein DFH09DRAFT_1421641 [Mycena vulgaris]
MCTTRATTSASTFRAELSSLQRRGASDAPRADASRISAAPPARRRGRAHGGPPRPHASAASTPTPTPTAHAPPHCTREEGLQVLLFAPASARSTTLCRPLMSPRPSAPPAAHRRCTTPPPARTSDALRSDARLGHAQVSGARDARRLRDCSPRAHHPRPDTRRQRISRASTPGVISPFPDATHTPQPAPPRVCGRCTPCRIVRHPARYTSIWALAYARPRETRTHGDGRARDGGRRAALSRSLHDACGGMNGGEGSADVIGEWDEGLDIEERGRERGREERRGGWSGRGRGVSSRRMEAKGAGGGEKSANEEGEVKGAGGGERDGGGWGREDGEAMGQRETKGREQRGEEEAAVYECGAGGELRGVDGRGRGRTAGGWRAGGEKREGMGQWGRIRRERRKMRRAEAKREGGGEEAGWEGREEGTRGDGKGATTE